MLEIVRYDQDKYEFPSLLVLGCFDALHAGHYELLKKAKLQAKINGLDLGVMMFADGKGGRLVYTFEERKRLLESLNVRFILKIDFNESFKSISAEDFLKTLDESINIKGYMSGKDFRFGAGAKGKSSTLKNYADDEENGVWYMAVKDVTYHDEKISTTMIKSLLESGDIKTANELLTRNYSVTGEVIRGADRGKSLGFPTMNIIYPDNKAEVKFGVYAVECTIDGTVYRGIANYGPRPTFNDDRAMLEVYLDGFSRENYGEKITVGFTDYIRDIRKFADREELKAQLARDILKIR